MQEAVLTQREATWLACKQKTCCYASLVLVSGRDVWRISRTLDTPPWAFLAYIEAQGPGPDAFALDRSGRYFRLALAKRPSKRRKSAPPCIFLMRTHTGHHRCGLGDLRPQVCQVFPLDQWSGGICVMPHTGCTCRNWTLGDVNISQERDLLEQRNREAIEYYSVVAKWNAYVHTEAPKDGEGAPDFLAYCRYLLSTYDMLEAPGGTE